MAAEEIVRLKVDIIGATEAQISRLERLDKTLASLRRNGTVNIHVTGLSAGLSSAESSARGASSSVSSTGRNVSEEMRQLIQLQQMRDSIADAYARRQEEENRQFQEQQDRIQEGWEVIGEYLYRFLVQNIQKATDELKAMNAEMVDIQKVTKATDADMERMKNSAFEVSGALGSTPSDYLASVTKWAQAGYNALSEDLGELSAKTQVVGNVNEETANKFLLAVDAAYKYKGNINSLTRVLDGANEIGNQFATSVEKMAGGMGIVSSLAAQAGMKVEETVAAIGTITAVTQESGNSAARALRALILNIQGSTEIEIDAETGERWTEDEIQRTAAALDKLNIATREYKDGVVALRNPMEVIAEMSEKYRQGLITEAQLQEVIASLGGKVRSNQLMALISNYEMYNDMLEAYRNSMGSADRELDIYLNGWEAKSNRLTAQWVQFVESFDTTEIATGLLDFGNDLLEVANSGIGNVIAKTLTLTTAFAALNAVTRKIGINAAISGMISALASGTSVLQALGTALNSALGPVGWAVAGITLLVGIIDALTVSVEEQAQATADAVSAYEKEQAALEGLESQLKTTRDRIEELTSRGDSLTVVEREELDKLKEQNRDLEWQITLQEKLTKAKKEDAEAETRKSLAKGYTGADYSSDPARAFLGDEIMGGVDIKYVLGQLQGFENQGNYLIKMLDDLNERKQKFLSDNGDDAGKWSAETAEDFRKIKNEIETVQGVAVDFYDELYGHMENLPEAD